jgi:hypothetical protein
MLNTKLDFRVISDTFLEHYHGILGTFGVFRGGEVKHYVRTSFHLERKPKHSHMTWIVYRFIPEYT